MGGVSKDCLVGQAARHYAAPRYYQVRPAQPNTFHRLTLVFGRAAGTGHDDFEREGSHKAVWVGRLREIMLCLTITESDLHNQTHFINSP